MKRFVVAGLAGVALLSGGAIAQMDPEPAVSAGASPFLAVQDTATFMSDNIIGRPLYNAEGDSLGTISWLIFDEHGTIVGLIVGIGGFIGIGEKLVGVDIAAIDVTLDEDGALRWMLDTTTEALDAAPTITLLRDEDVPPRVPTIGIGAAGDTMMDPMPDPALAPAPEPAPAPAPDPMPAPEPAPAPADPAAGAAAGGDMMAMADGETVYTDNCAVCHGAEGEGTVGPALAGNDVLADAEAIAHQVLFGGEAMPAFGDRLDDNQVAAVGTYIRTNWGNDYGPVDPATVEGARAAGAP